MVLPGADDGTSGWGKGLQDRVSVLFLFKFRDVDVIYRLCIMYRNQVVASEEGKRNLREHSSHLCSSRVLIERGEENWNPKNVVRFLFVLLILTEHFLHFCCRL